ncbi:MAG: hypothetical protein D6160_17130 [Ketobacter sp.]|nr:MAG: hypothetical protein D6160_17130 [Ketobacter sp.]
MAVELQAAIGAPLQREIQHPKTVLLVLERRNSVLNACARNLAVRLHEMYDYSHLEPCAQSCSSDNEMTG